MTENFPEFMKYMDTDIQENQQTPSMIHSKRPTLMQIIIKLSKTKDKEKVLKSERSNLSYTSYPQNIINIFFIRNLGRQNEVD